jgi:3-phenylpropionate/trans-cinnamate dioxygenase ferredoxin reductase subunit
VSPEPAPERVVVAGLGAAGLAVCQELRGTGWSGRITVLAEEAGLPYDRPPLAKGFLTGKTGADDIGLVRAEALAALELDLHAGVRAAGLDADARVVTDSAGNRHPYDALVVCTGVRPRTLGFGGRGVHVLRTLDDARRLRADLLVGGRLVVVGGGFLGFEVAASARALGLDVTVVEPLVEPMRDRLGRELATRLLALHREHGVRLLTGSGVASVVPASELCGPLVRLADGTRLPADVVLVAAGAIPDTDWLSGSDVPVADGVVCDEYCRACPGVWAAGDVARWFHSTLGRQVRVEHRMNATEQGRAAARSVLGERRPFVPVPFVWTDQYDVRIQVAGFLDAAAPSRVSIGDEGADSFAVEWREDRLACVAGWNAARSIMPARRELAATWAHTEVAS